MKTSKGKHGPCVSTPYPTTACVSRSYSVIAGDVSFAA